MGEKIMRLVADRGFARRSARTCAASMMALGCLALLARATRDPLRLWARDRARREVERYDELYGNYRTNAFVVTGRSLTTREALRELRDFHEWMYRGGETRVDGVGLLDVCHKYVDVEPHAPCFQMTPLDCFRDGAVSVPGGERNGDFYGAYANRPSVDEYDFSKGFDWSTCKQWFNLDVPRKTMFSFGENDTVEAMRVVFQTRDAKSLARRGVVTTTWTLETRESADVLGCPTTAPMSDDCACVDSFNAFSVLEHGCVPQGDAAQPPSCCALMTRIRAHPCVETLWASDATLFALGNRVFETCGLPTVTLTSECVELPTGETVRATSNERRAEDLSASTPARNVFACASMLASLRTKCPKIVEGDFNAAGECCASLEDFTVSRCHCGELHCGGRSMPCDELFARDDVRQIVQFCALSGFETPSASPCESTTMTNKTTMDTAANVSSATGRTTEPRWMPTHARREISERDADRLLLEWESNWLAAVDAKLAEYEHIRVSYMAERSAEDVIADASRGVWALVLVGYAVVIAYVVIFFHVSSNPACGSRAALEGVLAVIASTWAALGVAGALSRFGVTFSAVTVQVLPFLSMGLGVNDFFVLASHASHAAARDLDDESVVEETMREGGASVTLSSVMNFAAFLLGSISPVPAVRWFGVQMACATACNYAVAVLVFPNVFHRHLERRAAATAARSDDEYAPLRRSSSIAKLSSAVCDPLWQWMETLPPSRSVAMRVAILSAYAAGAAYLLAGIPKVELGMNLRDVVPRASYMWRFVDDTERRFATYPVFVVVENVNFARHAVTARRLERDFLRAPRVDASYGSTNFLIYFTEHTEARIAGGRACSVDDATWYYDPARLNPRGDACADDAADENQTFVCMFKCLARAPQSRPASPLNRAPKEKRCEFHLGDVLKNERSRCHCPHRMIFNPDAFTREFPSFLRGGQRGDISRAFVTLDPTNESVVTSARFLFYVEDAHTIKQKLEHVREARKIIARSEIVAGAGARAFPFEVSLYALNDHYLTIERDTWLALGVGLAVSIIVMSITFDVKTALASATTLALVQTELFGAAARLGVPLDGASAMNLIASTGVSIESIAHMARALRHSTTRSFLDAWKSIAPALTNGAFTTLAGLAPVAFARYEYFRNFFFFHWCVIVLASATHGIVILPIALSFLRPSRRE